MKVLSGLFQVVWLALLAAGLWMLAQWLQLPPGIRLDAVIAVVTVLWLYFVITVPWNMVFQAQQMLFDAEVSHKRAIRLDPDAVPYVQRWARIDLWAALALHGFIALVLCAAAYSGVGLMGWLGAAASIVLTALRPGLRAYAHVRDRLGRFAREVEVPREDAAELRQRRHWLEQQVTDLTRQAAVATQHTEQQLAALTTRASAAADEHTSLSEHLRLEIVRVEREAKNTVAQILGDAAAVGHVRELVRFFKAA